MRAIRLCLLVSVLVCAAAAASADPVIFVIRHAERADTSPTAAMMANDPELAAAGRERAKALASMLKDADVKAIFTSEYRRTRQTAEPLARELNLEPTTIAAADTGALLQKLREATTNVLVVAHSDTIPAILKGLGVPGDVDVSEAYDNLFVVVRTPSPVLVRLHYR